MQAAAFAGCLFGVALVPRLQGLLAGCFFLVCHGSLLKEFEAATLAGPQPAMSEHRTPARDQVSAVCGVRFECQKIGSLAAQHRERHL
jgi:hypothetical protein